LRAAQALNLHRNVAEGSFDTVLNIYAGGAASYGAIGAQVALHRKAIAGRTQKRPAFNPDQTELALIYDSDTGSLLGVMAHRPRDFTAVADLRTPARVCGARPLAAGMPSASAFTARPAGVGDICRVMRNAKNRERQSYSPTPAHREGFAKKIMANTGVLVAAVNAPELAAKDVDIILCMTIRTFLLRWFLAGRGQYIIPSSAAISSW